MTMDYAIKTIELCGILSVIKRTKDPFIEALRGMNLRVKKVKPSAYWILTALERVFNKKASIPKNKTVRQFGISLDLNKLKFLSCIAGAEGSKPSLSLKIR